jgi:hypothetical protein
MSMRRSKHVPVQKTSPAPSAAKGLGAPARSLRGRHRSKETLAAVSLIVLAALAAYGSSFRGQFMLDDEYHIVDNPHIRRPFDSWRTLLGGARPVVAWTLAGNYALGGLDVWHYHAFNLAVHFLAALTLYGLVRRTLQLPRWRARYETAAPWLALAAALLWLVHPLQTASVTYVIQRCESLAGLFYLLTLYCVLRGAQATAGKWWYVAAIVCCALGMASKEVMCTAPVLVLLYDRVFLAPSFGQLFRRRWGLYVGLAATWGILVATVTAALQALPAGAEVSAGFGLKGTSPAQYARSQPGVIVHYLKLALWPDPLCLDYAWPVARTVDAILPPALVVGALLLATLWALRACPWLGYCGAWFFLILAPTSSVMPIADLAVEHRMYLPLAAVAVLVVLGGHAGLGILCGRLALGKRLSRCLAGGLVLALVVLLSWLTIRRNEDYQSPLSMWGAVVAQRPNNARAHTNLGVVLQRQGKVDEAARHFSEALRIRPHYAEAHNNLGWVLQRQGKMDEAARHFSEAVRIRPHYAEAHNNLGAALVHQGKEQEAARHFSEAVRIKPHYAEAHNN